MQLTKEERTKLGLPLDKAKEEKNAKTAINRMSGREACYFVYFKVKTVLGPPALARIFLGSIPVVPKDEAARLCKRQWPLHYPQGLILQLSPKTRS